MACRIRSLCARLVCVGAIASSGLACNMIDAVFNGDVAIDEMVPGQKAGSGQLDCWLTLEFKNLPEGISPTDVKVRFESVALVRPAEFGWRFIADHDLERRGERFGSGHVPILDTTPNTPPPLGRPLKVNFPLEGKRKIENAPRQIWLEATIYWGGVEQDSVRRLLEHTYSSTDGGFF